MSPEVVQRISILRQKMIDGTATVEELKEAVTLMRGDRKAAAAAPSGSSASRKKMAKAEIKSADEMLDELGKI